MTTPSRVLADEYWEFRLDTRHFSNLSRGELSRLESWDDLSAEGSSAAREACLRFASRAGNSNAAAGADRTLAETVGAAAFMDASVGVWWPQLGAASLQAGLLTMLVPALHLQPLVTGDHGRRYLEKLRRFPEMIDQLVGRLEEGASLGRVPLARHVTQTVGKLDQILALAPESHPIATQAAPIELSAADASRWRGDLVDAVDNHVRPALAAFARALREVSLPAGRSSRHAGLCHLSGGDAVYGAMVRGHTTLDLDPERIHELGLARVELLEDEYRRIAGPLLGTRELPEIYSRLRDDPALQYSRSEDLVADALRCLEKAGAAMGGWFDPTPRAPCRADPIDVGAMAYYYPPTPDGVRPGRFFFNVSDPAAWGTYQIPAVAYHEGIPGHHLQIALAIENDTIHDLHRNCYLPAFGEGWGLYSERLSDEMGLYADDWQRVGMLTADSLRAGRLVVDTGIHALGWSRGRAVEFLADHSSMSLHEIEEEVDRYIAIPGQALSYMLGRLEIESLRAEAETRLGGSFDIKAFHRTVLGSGSVPLGTLRRLVVEWIKQD
ncbi:MAG: DUF885 domain-containing protein [bacterium]|nr:DUF885 domain-containing protein [bacterium]MDE0290735.1 DUF885 domain-containing protein [bacterium]MDE0440039.1 DUF885 domain-containing protein [bacterium]